MDKRQLQDLDSLEFYDDEPMSLLQLTKNDTFLKIMLNESDWADIETVSYTHLDVYKRQSYDKIKPR